MTDSRMLSAAHLDYLRRADVDPTTVLPGTARAPPAPRRLWRIPSVGRPARSTPDGQGAPPPRPPSEDVLVGLYGYKIPLAFLLTGDTRGGGVPGRPWLPEEPSPPSVDPILDGRERVLRTVLDSL